MEITDQQWALSRLAEYFPPTHYINTVIVNVSRDGMARTVKVLAGIDHGQVKDVSGLVATALDYRFDRRRHGVRISGAGFDAGHAVAYDISLALYGHDPACKHYGI